jgi:hypothetical protein
LGAHYIEIMKELTLLVEEGAVITIGEVSGFFTSQ